LLILLVIKIFFFFFFLKNFNLIKKGFCVDKNKFGIVLEFCENGTLNRYLEINGEKIDWKLKLKILIDISKGMDYLHFKKIIHRDLKPDNVFYF
jgi:serine/threonine protein kinase